MPERVRCKIHSPGTWLPLFTLQFPQVPVYAIRKTKYYLVFQREQDAFVKHFLMLVITYPYLINLSTTAVSNHVLDLNLVMTYSSLAVRMQGWLLILALGWY